MNSFLSMAAQCSRCGRNATQCHTAARPGILPLQSFRLVSNTRIGVAPTSPRLLRGRVAVGVLTLVWATCTRSDCPSAVNGTTLRWPVGGQSQFGIRKRSTWMARSWMDSGNKAANFFRLTRDLHIDFGDGHLVKARCVAVGM